MQSAQPSVELRLHSCPVGAALHQRHLALVKLLYGFLLPNLRPLEHHVAVKDHSS